MEKAELEKFICDLGANEDSIPIAIIDFDKFVKYSQIDLESILNEYDTLNDRNSEEISARFLRPFVNPELRERISNIYSNRDIDDNNKLFLLMGVKVLIYTIKIRPGMGSSKFWDNAKRYFVKGSLDGLPDGKYKFLIEETNITSLSRSEITFDSSEDSYIQDDISLKIVLEVL